MKKFYKKIISIILSVVLVLSSMIGIIPTLAAYKEGDKVKVSSTHHTTMFTKSYIGIHNGKKMSMHPYSHKTAKGDYVYCIDNEVNPNNVSMTVKNLEKTKSWKALSSKQQDMIRKVTMYARPNYSYSTETKDAIAAQLIIKEIQYKYRTSFKKGDYTSGLGSSSDARSIYNCAKSVADVFKAYKGIIDRCATHDKKPSFDKKSVTMFWSQSTKKYIYVLEDTNGILSDFKIKSTGKATATISGNKLTITTATKGLTGKVTLVKKGTDVNDAKALYLDDSKQTLLLGTAGEKVESTVSYKVQEDALIKIKKTSTNGGTVLGIKFTVFSKTAGIFPSREFTTDNNGEIVITGLKPNFEYTIKETVPDNCATPQISATGSNTINGDTITVKPTPGQTITVNCKNTIAKGSLKIVKMDKKTKARLKGAVFKITGPNGYEVTSATDENGEITLNGLEFGHYDIVELQAPEGYFATEVTTHAEVKTTTIEEVPIYNEFEEVGYLVLTKIDSVNDAALSGAEFDIYRKSNNEKITVFPIIIGKNGTGMSEMLDPGDYYLVETKAPVGYKLDSTPIDFTITEGETTQLSYTPVTNVSLPDANDYINYETQENYIVICNCCEECTNSPDCQCTNENCVCADTSKYFYKKNVYNYGSVTVKVVNKYSTSQGIYGAVVNAFYVDDANNESEAIAAGITDSSGTIVFSNVPVGKKIRFKQTLSMNTKFDVDSETKDVVLSGTNTEVVFNDTVANNATQPVSYTHLVIKNDPNIVRIFKKDGDNKEPKANALLHVEDSNGNVIAEELTNLEGYIQLYAIAPGEYFVKELVAPDGYVLNEQDYKFVVKEDGTVEGTTVIYDVKTKVVLHKTDVTTAKGVPGAQITIYNDDKQPIWQGITDKDGNTTITGLPAGTYTFKETIAPNGYLINETVFTFTLNDDGTVEGDTTVSDEPIVVILSKNDAQTLEPLKGVKFHLYDSNKKDLGEFITDENGEIAFRGLAAGTYFYKETEALENYLIDESEHQFTVKTDGTVEGNLIVSNERAHGTVVVDKTDTDGNPLEGAEFECFRDVDGDGKYDEDIDESVGLLEEFEDGEHMMSLPIGSYLLHEKKAPVNCVKDSGYYAFEIYEENVEVAVSNRKESADFVNEKIIKTGLDVALLVIIGVLIIGSGVGIVILMKKRKAAQAETAE